MTARPITISTHILDSAGGGGRSGVTVVVRDRSGNLVASGVTDNTGRIDELAAGLAPGDYQLIWHVDGAFVQEAAVKVHLGDIRHYHVPLLSSDHSATVYLGA